MISLYDRLKDEHKHKLERWVRKYPASGGVLVRQLTSKEELNELTLGAFQSLWLAVGYGKQGLLYWEFYKNRYDYFND